MGYVLCNNCNQHGTTYDMCDSLVTCPVCKGSKKVWSDKKKDEWKEVVNGREQFINICK